jgi:hypothetical protein
VQSFTATVGWFEHFKGCHAMDFMKLKFTEKAEAADLEAA